MMAERNMWERDVEASTAVAHPQEQCTTAPGGPPETKHDLWEVTGKYKASIPSPP